MKRISKFSEDKFKIWYMNREYKKREIENVPDENELFDEFKRDHSSGKGLSQFYPCRWDIVVLTQEEFGNLIHLKSRWTDQDGLTRDGGSRRLIEVTRRSESTDYWDNPHPKHQDYYEQFKTGSLHLSGINRVVVRNATISEKTNDPDAQFYLHDGTGRGLAYMRAILRNEIKFQSAEAIYADTNRL